MYLPSAGLTHVAAHAFHSAGEGVGCMLWGLVNGKTQTDLPWGHRPGDPAPAIWQHGLYQGNFMPYDTAEIATLKRYISLSKEKR